MECVHNVLPLPPTDGKGTPMNGKGRRGYMITTPLRVRKGQQATSSTHKEVEVDSIPG